MSFTDAEVYRKHKDELMRFAAALVGPSHAADVVSNVVTRILAAGRWHALDLGALDPFDVAILADSVLVLARDGDGTPHQITARH